MAPLESAPLRIMPVSSTLPLRSPALKFHRLWFAIGIALILVLLYGSLAPATAMPPLGGSDKFWHTATYFVVMVYFAQIYSTLRSRLSIAAALIALGVLIEFIQPLVNRQFDWFDALANAVGVAAALLISLSRLRLILLWVDDRLHRYLQA